MENSVTATGDQYLDDLRLDLTHDPETASMISRMPVPEKIRYDSAHLWHAALFSKDNTLRNSAYSEVLVANRTGRSRIETPDAELPKIPL
jgi:hypothetical protein